MTVFKQLIRSFFVIGLLLVSCTFALAGATELPKDPLNSVMWKQMAENYLLNDPASKGQIKVSQNVVVKSPKTAEDQFYVPIHVKVKDLKNVVKIVVLADLNPIVRVLNYYPENSDAVIGFRMKLNQGSPIRAAVLTKDGVWHMNGTYVDAAGGGCSAPAAAYAQADWTERLGEVKARVWAKGLGQDYGRMRVKVRHPMDTGLADGIPAFYVNKLAVKNMNGEGVARFELFEPVSENPALTFRPRLKDGQSKLAIVGRDTGGNEINAFVSVPTKASSLAR